MIVHPLGFLVFSATLHESKPTSCRQLHLLQPDPHPVPKRSVCPSLPLREPLPQRPAASAASAAPRKASLWLWLPKCDSWNTAQLLLTVKNLPASARVTGGPRKAKKRTGAGLSGPPRGLMGTFNRSILSCTVPQNTSNIVTTNIKISIVWYLL